MQHNAVSDLIRKNFAAFLAKDRKTLEEVKDGTTLRNTEFYRVEGNRTKEVEVFSGSA